MMQWRWTPSNVISLARLGLLPPLAWALLADATGWVVAIGLLSFLSDMLDGMLARRRGEVTELGKLLDPLADKLLAGTAAVVLTLQGRLPVWFTAVLLLRELVVLLGGWIAWRRFAVALPALVPGKLAATVTAAALFAAYFQVPFLPWILAVALGFIGVATLVYGRRWWRLRRRAVGEKVVS